MTQPRLARSSDRIVAGVCAGIADFLGWQPISIRTLFGVVTVMSGGTFALMYLLLWWMMPVAQSPRSFRLDDFRS